MIHEVFSTLPTFKAISFKSGLNILLADKSRDATDLQTRNRAGKSSFVEIVHFLMGANATPQSIFRQPPLSDEMFGINFDLAGEQCVVTRSGRRPSRIRIDQASTEGWPVQPSVDKKSGDLGISNDNWKQVLGALMFDLPDPESQPMKFGPTFRMLFSYFVRRQSANAFADPFKQFGMQFLWDQQVAVSFLLGLDWTIPQEWQTVRQRENEIEELKRAAVQGTFGAVIGTVAELRTELAVVNAQVRRLRNSLDQFRVLPEYQRYEDEASEIAQEVGRLIDLNTVDLRLISEMRGSLAQESVPSLPDVEEVYRQAGIVLPELVVRRIDEVSDFHQSVIRNRQSYLNGEIANAQQRVSERQQKLQDLERRQSELMRVLNSHGALDQYTELRSELSRLEAGAEAIRLRYDAAERLEGTRTQLELERNQLLLRLQQDHREQEETLRQAIVTFQEISAALYEDAGYLTISESANGPRFEVVIHGSRSKGITSMQIFCFDMMLMRLCADRGIGPGFLVHDSHLFDGVDERQIAKALEIGATTATEFGFQYIVTMNSDAIPSPNVFDRGFSVNEHVLSTRLTDASEDGGLFGVRFG